MSSSGILVAWMLQAESRPSLTEALKEAYTSKVWLAWRHLSQKGLAAGAQCDNSAAPGREQICSALLHMQRGGSRRRSTPTSEQPNWAPGYPVSAAAAAAAAPGAYGISTPAAPKYPTVAA